MRFLGHRRRRDPLGRAVIDAADLMYQRGLVIGTVGNVSARSGDEFLITPTRRSYGDLRPDDLVRIPIKGFPTLAAPQEASLEWRLHAAVYAASAGVDAIAHTHSPYATARSFDAASLHFVTEESSYFGISQVEVIAGAAAGSLELARGVADALTRQPACLIARHGVVAGAKGPRAAVELAAAVEHQAQIQWLACPAQAPQF